MEIAFNVVILPEKIRIKKAPVIYFYKNETY